MKQPTTNRNIRGPVTVTSRHSQDRSDDGILSIFAHKRAIHTRFPIILLLVWLFHIEQSYLGVINILIKWLTIVNPNSKSSRWSICRVKIDFLCPNIFISLTHWLLWSVVLASRLRKGHVVAGVREWPSSEVVAKIDGRGKEGAKGLCVLP